MRLSNPIVLITRPEDAARRFGEALHRMCSRPFRTIMSPAFGYEDLTFEPVTGRYQAIFTSSYAVPQIEMTKRVAWCVGDQTSAKAHAAGFNAQNAAGSAADLLRLILEHHPTEPLVHFRGEVSRGDIALRLNRVGLRCDERIVYRKRRLPLIRDAQVALNGKEPILLPLFSPQTATILALSGPFSAPLHVVAMSDAVAEQVQRLNPQSVSIVGRPRSIEMSERVAALIA